MRVFVTGGTGFIGSHVVEKLAAGGHEMRCLARRAADTTRLERAGASVTRGDVADRRALLEGMTGCEQVIHLAAAYAFWLPDRRVYRSVNVDGTRNVMECALEAGATKVVHVSSVVVYGKPAARPFREGTPPGPVRFSEYARTKHEGDLIAWDMSRDRGLPIVVVYPGGVLGPGDPKATGEYILNLIRRRLPATVFDGSVFPWVHVADVAEAIVLAAEKAGNVGERYIVAKHNLTFGQINRLVAEVARVPLPRFRLPDSVAMLNAAFLTGIANVIRRPPLWGLALDQARTMKAGAEADGSKAERELGLAYTPIRVAIEEEVASLGG
jgi:dihydroflavonol-4-reductase